MEEQPDKTSAIVFNKKDNIIDDKPANYKIHPETTYEVFRNNMTAVEVVVKDVISKGKRITGIDANDVKVNKLQALIKQMHCQLDTTNKSLVRAKRGFLIIVEELRKQLEVAYSRESDAQAANLALKLENEKLRVLLDSKMKLLVKMKKEMSGMRRALKFVVKCILKAPEKPKNTEIDTDSEYEDFENDLTKEDHKNFTRNIFDKSNTFDTTVSRDNQYFDKKCC